ncbi:MAG: hypothetical protein QMD00_02090 [Hadesarchaea archaeon]|nr:hypothetical protein [Hadesarchaea archaeon]
MSQSRITRGRIFTAEIGRGHPEFTPVEIKTSVTQPRGAARLKVLAAFPWAGDRV